MAIPGTALRTQDSPERIAVIGAVGCGKSTLARALAARYGLPYVELDSILYAPHWKKAEEQTFYDEVVRHAGGSEWVIDGNYEAVRDIVWIRARVVIWLDYPLRLVIWRLMKRTTGRLLTGEVFANGNRETFWRLIGPNSIFVWAIRSHRRRHTKIENLLSGARYAHLRVLRFQSPRETKAWLANLGSTTPAHSRGLAVNHDARANDADV